MEVKNNIDILNHDWWGRAKDTVNECVELGYGDELEQLVEEHFAGRIPDEEEVNDFLWFERDYIWNVLEQMRDDEEE